MSVVSATRHAQSFVFEYWSAVCWESLPLNFGSKTLDYEELLTNVGNG